MTASSSSFCVFDPNLCKYDVFISFRGDDTRLGFTSHLYKALCRNDINAFIDQEKLEKGEVITRALLKAIEESEISIIIFSTDFASSTWCLDELLHILKCKEKGQIVLPIFYGVNPSDIRKQEKSYHDAFVKHCNRFKNQMDKVQEWRQALIEASGLCGWDSRSQLESDIVEEVVKRVKEALKNIRSNGGIEDLLLSLTTKLQLANMVLDVAEEKQLTDEGVKKWLGHLKEVIFRAEELTDKVNYEELRRQQEGASESSTSFATSVVDEVAKILAELEELTDVIDKLGLKVPSPTLHGPPLAVESEVCGRADDKEAIIKLVVSDESCCDKIPVVLPIAGMGGIGKTTLAQLVFYDQRVENHFRIKVWVRVSTKPDVVNITKQIFKRVTNTESSNEELCLLQRDLEKALERKKFLLVLDDVWNEDCFWDDLRRPFTSGASGSKIIITTRSTTVASMVNNNCDKHRYNLRGLEASICWDSFIRYAFKNEDLNDHPDLCEIGKNIVRKCGGLPLAVKSVAALLGPIRSPQEWREILESPIWESNLQETTRNKILPALWLSYSYLSLQLKKCFAYCSIFPKDHEFLRRELILLWMAEGLLQSKGGKTMEDVGKEYFEILTSRSFFQPVESKSRFIMHGCMHDLATFVLGEFGFRLEGNNLNLPKEARHLVIVKKYICDLKQFDGLFKGLISSKAKCLRTFLALEFDKSPLHMVPLQELATKEGRLRVVSLPHFLSITELPDSVRNFKYLRYLDLSYTGIREIPSTIYYLYNLETLLLKSCRSLHELPAEIGRLLKLRHLDFDGSAIEKFAPQICYLKELQTLTRFIVCKEDGGSRIKELGDLQHLGGKFDISGLENVVDVQNVSEAKLRDKNFLTMLRLCWCGDSAGSGDPEKHKQVLGSSDPEKHKQVLDQLRPHTNLKTLCISGYNGRNFSNWMGDQSFRQIVKVELVKCGKCNSLSPIEQLPSLKELWIREWPVETLHSEIKSNGSSETDPFKCLEALYFFDMPDWTKWLLTDGAFPCLKQLRFDECPKLDVSLPDCFPALTTLAVIFCRQLMPLLTPGNTHQGRGRRFSFLEELEILACPEQKDFSNGELPSSLKKISIDGISKNIEELSTPDLPLPPKKKRKLRDVLPAT